MTLGELSGYVASLLVFAAFYMTSMAPLRLVAIASNLAFIVYALCYGLTPVLVLHGALLPLNILRFRQFRRFVSEVEGLAADELPLRPLLPFMKRMEFRAGDTLFGIDEPADDIFYLVCGTVFLREVEKEIRPGSFLDASAWFSETGRQTRTAIAQTNCVAMVLPKDAMLAELQRNPGLAVQFLRLAARRRPAPTPRHSLKASARVSPPSARFWNARIVSRRGNCIQAARVTGWR